MSTAHTAEWRSGRPGTRLRGGTVVRVLRAAGVDGGLATSVTLRARQLDQAAALPMLAARFAAPWFGPCARDEPVRARASPPRRPSGHHPPCHGPCLAAGAAWWRAGGRRTLALSAGVLRSSGLESSAAARAPIPLAEIVGAIPVHGHRSHRRPADRPRRGAPCRGRVGLAARAAAAGEHHPPGLAQGQGLWRAETATYGRRSS